MAGYSAVGAEASQERSGFPGEAAAAPATYTTAQTRYIVPETAAPQQASISYSITPRTTHCSQDGVTEFYEVGPAKQLQDGASAAAAPAIAAYGDSISAGLLSSRSVMDSARQLLSDSRPDGGSGAGPFVFVGLVLAFYLWFLGNAFEYKFVDEELGYQASLTLNMWIFFAGLIWWVLKPIQTCKWALQRFFKYLARVCCARRPAGASATSDRLLSEYSRSLSAQEGATPTINQSSAACNYLMYLQACTFLFFALAAINLVFSLGLSSTMSMTNARLAYDPTQMESDEVYEQILEMSLWFINGVVALLFIQVIRVNTQVKVKSASNDRLRRTIWFSKLPRRDGQTGEKFRLDNDRFNEVRTALVRSIDDFFTMDAKVMRTKLTWSDVDILEAERQLKKLGFEITKPPDGYESRTSSKVEECMVTPQTDHWNRKRAKLKWTQELKAYYHGKMLAHKEAVSALQETRQTSCCTCSRLRYNRLCLWYWESKYNAKVLAEERLQTIMKGFEREKILSGSAFVTFKEEADYEKMLSHFHRCHLLRFQHYTLFTFGRPPFGSVTLRCEQAPAPSDIDWANLHISFFSKILNGLFAQICVLVFYFCLILPLIFLMFSGHMKEVLTFEEALLYGIAHNTDQSGFFRYAAEFLIHNEAVITRQAPSILLLFLNSALMPALAGYAEESKRCTLKSSTEVQKMDAMVFFLCLSLLIMPFSGMKAIQSIPCSFHMKGKTESILQKICNEANNLHGMAPQFAMEYLINAAFILFISQLWNVKQNCWKSWRSVFYNREIPTNREKLTKPWLYPWGFWYAFTLSIFALAMIVGMFAPSVFPMAAVFFWLRFMVDKVSLSKNVFDFTICEERLIVAAIRVMRVMVGVSWIAVGLWKTFHFKVPLDSAEMSNKEMWLTWFKLTFSRENIRWEGTIFIVLGFFVVVWAFVRFAQHYLAVKPEMRNNDMEHDLCLLTCGCVNNEKTKEKFRRFASSLGLTTADDSLEEEDATSRSWDCLRLLDLEDSKALHAKHGFTSAYA